LAFAVFVSLKIEEMFMIKKLLIFLIPFFTYSFSIKKDKKFIPPGTVQITETFFADETEISNLSWREYEVWTKTKYGSLSPEHISCLPDTLVWREKLAYNEPYVEYYYRHPAYKDYPVVGISYEQALAFCKWRTERVKTFCYIRDKKEKNIEYRLPTKEEWEMISNNGVDVFANNGRNKKGQVLFNHVRYDEDSMSVAGYMSDNADVTAPVYSYWKNSFGLFCAFGNVAEMISEKGISKGGSWRNRLEECRPGKEITYTKSAAWLGFRCVCVVKRNINSDN
jgi:formylglycine-generating enzyme required for sulfatase activity